MGATEDLMVGVKIGCEKKSGQCGIFLEHNLSISEDLSYVEYNLCGLI